MSLSQLFDTLSKKIENFTWTEGVTPLTSLQVPIVASLLYLLAIVTLQRVMQHRAPIKLKGLVAFHNVTMASSSFIMLSGMAYYLVPFFLKHGLYEGVCDKSRMLERGGHMFWFYLFYLSKMYEFLDTFYQIIRKKQLQFLHVYHHLITLWLIWVTMSAKFSVQWVDISTNAFVHIFMYYYYFLSESGKIIWWKRYITKIQIFQFFC